MNFLDENGLGRLWAQIILKLNSKVPDGGTTGQVLKKTETGTGWADTPVPDWNQNDSTAADYVKNRPFYTGDPVETVLVEESTVAVAGADGVYAAEFPSTFEATVGETYKISWDGTVYECTCLVFRDTLVLGNLSILGQGSDTGEPFIMAVINGNGIVIYTTSSSSHTFSISGTDVPVIKIDKKYLPDTSTTQTITLLTSGWAQSGNRYSQTVNVTGVTASSNGSLRIAQSATDEQFAAWGAAKPRVTAQTAGTLTVKAAGTLPTIDIPVEVLIV